jgi:hypothetical protein
MPLLLALPERPPKPVSSSTMARDGLNLVEAHIEHAAAQFFDDILPKWLRPKKQTINKE